MSVTPNVVTIYGSLKMPEADSATTGGAVDLTKRVAFYDIPATGTLDVVSSSASDTATKIQIAGRDSTGTIVTPSAITLTGTTPLTSTFAGQTFERLLYGITSTGNTASGSSFPLANPTGTAAVGDVAAYATTKLITGHTCQAGSANTSGTTPPLMKLQSGDGATIGALTYAGLGLVIRITGGTGANQLRYVCVPYSSGAYGADIIAVNRDWSVIPDNTSTYDISYGMVFEILPNPVTAITRIFATSQADIPGGSQRIFYEKAFALNTNATTSLTNAQLEILSETPSLPGSALLDLALTKVLNDTATTANRQTLPANGDSTSLSFVTQPSLISVIASPGSLPAGNAAADTQGLWYRLTLPAGTTAYKGTADTRVVGATI